MLATSSSAYVPQGIEELLGYVVLAVGILEGQIEHVVPLQHLVALLGFISRTVQRPAITVDVNLDVDVIACY